MRTPTRTRRPRSSAHGGAKTIDDYLARVEPDQRAALETVRRVIRKAAPKAEEVITYGIPAFKQNGFVIGFAASAKHCSLHPMNNHTVADFAADLTGYSTEVRGRFASRQTNRSPQRSCERSSRPESPRTRPMPKRRRPCPEGESGRRRTRTDMLPRSRLDLASAHTEDRCLRSTAIKPVTRRIANVSSSSVTARGHWSHR